MGQWLVTYSQYQLYRADASLSIVLGKPDKQASAYKPHTGGKVEHCVNTNEIGYYPTQKWPYSHAYAHCQGNYGDS
jgi:hypothetical protein